MTARVVVSMRDVCKSFGDVEVLRHLNLELCEGETFVLLGGSGSGKTVLLKHLEGLLQPDSGQVVIDGHDLSNRRELDGVRRQLGVQFQSGALFDSMTAAENVAFPLRERRVETAEIKRRVASLLEMVQLSDVADKLPQDLSGGMRKRLAFARAMALEPKVLLSDEPTAGLDPLTTETVDDAIVAAQRRLGITALIITHDLPTAFRIADRVGLLYEGQIVEASTPAQFRASKHPAVRAFLKDWQARESEARRG